MYKVSILIPAYNEKQNIPHLLKALKRQRVSLPFSIREIVVVSCSTDGTDDIVKRMKDERIKLIRQPVRDGKAAAINLFLQDSDSDIIVIESADTLPEDYALENLLRPLLKPDVGLTAARPIPIDNPGNLITAMVRGIWHLHHQVSLYNPPKVGEMIAFRRVIDKIPEKSAADEESISALIQQRGYKVIYVPHAAVFNKGPERIYELWRQRLRIFKAHLWIKEYQHYKVPTLDISRLSKVLIKEVVKNPKKVFTLPPLILFEVLVRIVGTFQYYLGDEDESVWPIAKTTKQLI
jgi:cellulose synthase/poly-beta-1,6-N-acetylglucosamine synthase-like glycosyltransferase